MSQRLPPRVTLAQLLTVPIFAAVALACIAPAVRTGAVTSYGLIQVVLWEAILVPLALAITAQVLLRRGRGRERMVSGFLWLSTMAAIVALLVVGAGTLLDIGSAFANDGQPPVDLIAFAIALAGGLIALGTARRSLWSRAFPVRCPSCGRRALSVEAGRADAPDRSPVASFACEACGSRWRRAREGLQSIVDDGPGGAGSRLPAMIAHSAW